MVADEVAKDIVDAAIKVHRSLGPDCWNQPVNLKTAVSQRGTETTEAADKERHLQKVLKNGYPRGEDKASDPLFHWLCALRDSVAIPTAGFRIKRTRLIYLKDCFLGVLGVSASGSRLGRSMKLPLMGRTLTCSDRLGPAVTLFIQTSLDKFADLR